MVIALVDFHKPVNSVHVQCTCIYLKFSNQRFYPNAFKCFTHPCRKHNVHLCALEIVYVCVRLCPRSYTCMHLCVRSCTCVGVPTRLIMLTITKSVPPASCKGNRGLSAHQYTHTHYHHALLVCVCLRSCVHVCVHFDLCKLRVHCVCDLLPDFN